MATRSATEWSRRSRPTRSVNRGNYEVELCKANGYIERRYIFKECIKDRKKARHVIILILQAYELRSLYHPTFTLDLVRVRSHIIVSLLVFSGTLVKQFGAHYGASSQTLFQRVGVVNPFRALTMSRDHYFSMQDVNHRIARQQRS